MKDSITIDYLNINEIIQSTKIERIDFANNHEKKFFETMKQYASFEDSWFSLVQGIRQNPQIFLRKIYFSRHPYENNCIVVYNHLCVDNLEFTRALNDLLLQLNIRKAIWKNAKITEINELQSYGFEAYRDAEGWCEESRYDDQTFPQYVCSVKDIALLQRSYFAQIRQQTRRVEKKYQIEILPYKENYREGCFQLCQKVSLEISKGRPEKFNNVLSANLIYLNYTPEYSYIIKIDGRIAGFIAFNVRNSIANFNCLYYDRSVKYLATFIMVYAARQLENIGVDLLNLSGSESKGLDHWKKKFLPIKKIYRTHMVLRCKYY